MSKAMDDSRLREALLAAQEERFRNAWNGEDTPEYSEDYLNWEQTFLKETARLTPKRHLRLKTALAAAAAAVLLVGCTSVVVTSPEVQETVQQTVRQIFKREIEVDGRLTTPVEVYTDDQNRFLAETQVWDITFNDGTVDHYYSISWREGGLSDAISSEEQEYDPQASPAITEKEIQEAGEWRIGGLPEDFELIECRHTYNYSEGFMASAHFKEWDKVKITGHWLSYEWRDGKKYQHISLYYTMGDWTQGGGCSGDSISWEETEVNGNFALFLENGTGYYKLFWKDQESGVHFHLSGHRFDEDWVDFTKEELLQLAESVYWEGPSAPVTRDNFQG